MLVMFFLGNLAIPTLYRAFKMNHHREALHGRILERTALLAAFQLLDMEKQGYLGVNQFKKVLQQVRPEMFQKVTGLEKIKGISRSMFRELARTDPEAQKLYPIDFFRCCEVILVDYKVKRQNSSSDLFSRISRKRFVQDFRRNMTTLLESEAYDRVILFVCCVVTVICTDYHNNTFMSNADIDIVGNTWVGLCVLEMLLKIYFVGWESFWGTWRNR
jgi:predicted secreted protein